ncbi:MAG: zinc metalloprotease HtpX [Alphaproteobacteria bacterium]|nr:zinc metalloprotease HtpX [Alphaproteobacteria bacterium]
MNIVKTGVLLAALTAVFVGAGFLIAGTTGMIVALLLALGTNAFAYWNSGSLLLRTYGARAVTRTSDPEFYGLVADLAKRADLPMPRVYLIDSDQPNAFATGRNPDHAAVAATTGLLATLTREEVAGVIGHELAHIRNYDTLIMTVAASLAGAIAAFADIGMIFGGGGGRDEAGQPSSPGLIGGLLLMILAPLAAVLIQMAISRTREYDADRIGAAICGQPVWLADALVRIHHGVRQFANPAAEVNPATAHLFIINPLQGVRMAELFSTHPPTGERVRRLRMMTGEAGGAIGRVARASVTVAGPSVRRPNRLA